jgi:hypothetical protein
MSDSVRLRTANWVAAALVAIPAVLELSLILHHPVPARTGGSAMAADPFGGIAAVVDANRAFHAVLIMLMLAQLTGWLLLARKLGLDRALVVAGSIFCAFATVLLLLATSYDGFVTFELISRCRASADGCGADTRIALSMIAAPVQAFTKLGLVAQSFGFAAFACALLRSAGQLRVAGAIGLILALAPLGLLMSRSYIGAALIMQILIAHALLAIGAAFLLGFGWIDRALDFDDRCSSIRRG